MSWYNTGSNREEFMSKEGYPQSLNRFWIKEQETKEIIFLEDQPFGVYEHLLQTEGKWKNYTCSNKNCYICEEMKQNRSYKEYYTIIDLTPYTSKRNHQTYSYSKKALSLPKNQAIEIEKLRKEYGGTLKGKRFKVTRSSGKSASCGDRFQYLGTQNLDEYSNEKGFNFRELLEPKSYQDLKSELSVNQNLIPRESLKVSDDIPF